MDYAAVYETVVYDDIAHDQCHAENFGYSDYQNGQSVAIMKRNLLRPEQFERFYWPSLKKLLDAYADKGIGLVGVDHVLDTVSDDVA